MTPWNEPIHVTAHDPMWPRVFAEEALALARVTPPAARIEHIGSTSVPGLAAKPIVDIQVGVTQPLDEARFHALLAPLGYESMGEAGIPGRLYFRRRGPRSFNVHVLELGGVLWQNNLALRDYLRVMLDVAARYGQHKLAVVAAGANDLSTYSQGKEALVEALIVEAQRWRASVTNERDPTHQAKPAGEPAG